MFKSKLTELIVAVGNYSNPFFIQLLAIKEQQNDFDIKPKPTILVTDTFLWASIADCKYMIPINIHIFPLITCQL